MLDRLIDFAVHKRAATLGTTLAFAIFGIVTFGKLKIEAFPDVTNVQVMVITLYPGQAPEEVEKQVTIPVERALNGTPRVLVQRSITSFGLSQVILTFEDDVDIYWARQQVAERLPEAEVPDGIEPHLGPERHAGRAGLPVHAGERPPHAERAPELAGLGGLEAPDAGGRRRRRGQLRRLPEGVPRPRRSRPSCARTASCSKDLIDAVGESNGATSGGYVQHGEAEMVVRGRGYLKSAARHREHRRARDRRHAGAGAQRRPGGRGLHAAARVGGARRGHRLDRGDGAAAAGREPQGGAGRGARGGRADQPRASAAGDEDRPVLRPHPPRRHDAEHRLAQHAGGDRARQRGRLDVPARLHRVAGGVAGDAAGAADGVRRPPLRRRARESVVDGGDRLRHPAGRGGHPGRERLPPPGAREAAARAGGARGGRLRQGGDPPDAVLDGDHRGGDAADLHPRAGRGADLPAGGAHLRVRARGGAAVHAHLRAGVDRGAAQEPTGHREAPAVPQVAGGAVPGAACG